MMKNVRLNKPAIVSRAKSEPTPPPFPRSSELDESREDNGRFKCAAVYWKENIKGISFPENGRMKLDNTHLLFSGIFGTKIECDLKNIISVERAARMGGMVRDAFRVLMRSSDLSGERNGVQHVDDDSNNMSYLFTIVVKDHTVVMDRIQSAIDEASKRNGKDDGEMSEQQTLFRRLPPDDVLQKMTIIGKQKIRGVSMQDYFEVAWSEGHHCDKEPMYEPFLTSCEKNDVKVHKWESHEKGYKGEWCGETYNLQRIVTFNFMKKTIGETLVSVKHTQRCRRIDNDRCIVHMTLDMKGFPYADCFVVEVRHVASRVGDNDILVEIGLFVRFLKSCMFESKIRTNTSAETTKLQMTLLARVVEGCKPFAREQTGDDESDVMEGAVSIVAQRDSRMMHILTAVIQFMVTSILSMLLWPLIRLKLFDPPLPPPKSTMEALDNIRKRVLELQKISLNDNVPADQKASMVKEIRAVNAALSRIEAIATASKEG